MLPLNAYLLSHHCKGLKPALPIFYKIDCGPYLRCCPRWLVSFLSFSICLSMGWNTAHLASRFHLSTYMHLSVQTVNSCTGRLDVCQCLVVQTAMYVKSKEMCNAHSMTHVASKSKLRTVVRSSTHPCPRNLLCISLSYMRKPVHHL